MLETIWSRGTQIVARKICSVERLHHLFQWITSSGLLRFFSRVGCSE